MPLTLPSRSALAVLAALAALPVAYPLSAQQADAPAQDQPQTAPDMAEIEQAWARGDFVFVREGLRHLAETEGTPLAQYRYGRVLLEGRGGPVDIPAAVEWLERAAATNHLEATTLLARTYLSGMEGGPARNPARAAKLLAGAAARGDTEAQYYLGLLTREGEGVEKDLTQAFNWFLAASERGHVAAQYELARALSRGEGTAMNTAQALHWLSEAAAAGHAEAQFFMGNAEETGQGARKNMRSALNWYRRAAEGGMLLAQRRLGEIYLKGEGTDANPAEAMRWLGAAARAGDPRAMLLLGQGLRGDFGGTVDLAQAVQLFQAASRQDYGAATLALGDMARDGQGIPVDLAQAVQLYRKALTQGEPQAALRLGQLAGQGRLEGLAPPQNMVPWALAAAEQGDEAALTWLRTHAEAGLRPAQSAYGLWLLDRDQAAEGATLLQAAAQAGDVVAQYRLGLMLTTGEGVEQDYVQAHAWLNIAAASGHPDAPDKREVVSQLMTPEQVAQAQAVARAFFEQAAQQTQAPTQAGRN